MRKMQALAARHGVAKLRTVMEDLLTYSELKANEVFKSLPAGTYEFSDYLEDDTVSDVPIRIRLAMTVFADGRIHLDYTGTDPQAMGTVNCTQGVARAATYVPIIAVLDPDVPLNQGLLDLIEVHTPEGTLVNPV
jgi:N-methylhydantoinase B